MIAAFTLAILLLALDWRQTLRIFAAGRRELNPVIRWAHARFGAAGIHGYFAAWIAAAVAVTAWEHGAIALGAAAAVQALVVARNWRLGIRP